VQFGQKPEGNAIPFLRKLDDIKDFLGETYPKTTAQLQADATVQDSSVGAVAWRDDDDDEEVTSGGSHQLTKSTSDTKVRARDKNTAIQDVTSTYSKKLGHIVTKWCAWEAFRFSLGSDMLNAYTGTYNEGDTGFYQTLSAVKEAALNKTKSDLHAVPDYKLLTEFLPNKKTRLGTGTTYLAALLQTRLLGLRDNLGGVLIRDDDGPIYNPTHGESSMFDWYNKKPGGSTLATSRRRARRRGNLTISCSSPT